MDIIDKLAEIFKEFPGIGERQARNAAILLFTLRGNAFIYSGEEIGMTNLNTAKPLRDTRRYLRGPFDWTKAESQIKDPNSILNTVKQLIRERIKNK